MADRSCAACLQPITHGERFVLAGTEVFHDVCAAAGAIENSVGNKQKRRIVQLAATIERERKQHAYRAGELERHAESLAAELEKLRPLQDELRRLRDNHRCVVNANDVLHNQRSTLGQQVNNLNDEVLQLRAERDRLTRELALEKALAKADASLPPKDVPDDRDATEVRFSLLELK